MELDAGTDPGWGTAVMCLYVSMYVVVPGRSKASVILVGRSVAYIFQRTAVVI